MEEVFDRVGFHTIVTRTRENSEIFFLVHSAATSEQLSTIKSRGEIQAKPPSSVNVRHISSSFRFSESPGTDASPTSLFGHPYPSRSCRSRS